MTSFWRNCLRNLRVLPSNPSTCPATLSRQAHWSSHTGAGSPLNTHLPRAARRQRILAQPGLPPGFVEGASWATEGKPQPVATVSGLLRLDLGLMHHPANGQADARHGRHSFNSAPVWQGRRSALCGYPPADAVPGPPPWPMQPWASSQIACHLTRSRGVGARIILLCRPLAPFIVLPGSSPTPPRLQDTQSHYPMPLPFHLGFGLITWRSEERCHSGDPSSLTRA